ncbi:MAG: DUF4358 domain-containing protein [Hespellia sp.]|nr:DUF4358 domain-containing protein [Hespellia sp.]
MTKDGQRIDMEKKDQIRPEERKKKKPVRRKREAPDPETTVKKKKPLKRRRPETEPEEAEVRKRKPAAKKNPAHKSSVAGKQRPSVAGKQRPSVAGKQEPSSAGKQEPSVVSKQRPVKEKPPKQARIWTKEAARIEIGKYVITALMLGYVVFLLLGTGGSTKAFDKVEKSVENGIQVDTLTKASRQEIKRYYGLNSADYEGVMLYVSNSSTSAEETLLVEVKEEKQLQEVEQAIQARIANRKAAFDGYAQNQVDLLDNAVTYVRGRFIFFTVSKDASANKKVFTHSL